VSVREITKMLSALEKPCLAWRGINDFYYGKFAGAEKGEMSLPAFATSCAIWLQNALASVKLLNYGLAVFICFKEAPDADLVGALKGTGFSVVMLPRNPFTMPPPTSAVDQTQA